MTFLLLAVGGIAGALGRYHGARWLQSRFDSSFPIGTFVINISGSFALGLLGAILVRYPGWPVHELGLLFGTGFCGAYTTFSSFGWETVQLWRQGWRARAIFNLLGQPILCILVAWLGLQLGLYSR